jgi:hypothetical protein
MSDEILNGLEEANVEVEVLDTDLNTEEEEIKELELTEEEKAEKLTKEEKNKVQKRINELVREKNEYKRQLEAAKQAVVQDNPNYSPEIIASLVEEQAALLAEQKAFNTKCNSIFEAGVAKYADFADNIKTLNDLGLSANKDMFDTIVDSDNASDILQHLAENLEEAERLMALTPLKLVRELTKLELTLSDKPVTKNVKPVSKVPEPIKPLSGKGGAVAISAEKDALAWIAQRNRDLRNR